MSVISYGATVNEDHVSPLSESENADVVSMAIQAQTGDNNGINRLFAYCKGGNFNIHIWAWFGYLNSSAKQGKSGSIYNLVKN